MTEATSASPKTIDPQDQKNKHDPKLQVKSTHQLARKEEASNSSPEIAEMDYTPARKKSPIHN
ncbi:hypothetical protein Hanom_Chr10g00957281 [Helianthus anomalus]